MRVIKKRSLSDWWEAYPDARPGLQNWLSIAEAAEWSCHPDVVASAPGRPSPVGSEHIVFDIGGGKYRLVVTVYYQHRVIYVKWFGTHAEYNSVDIRLAENFSGRSKK